MKTHYTIQCGYAGYFANTVTVEAEMLEDALEKAIETANQNPGWKSVDHCGPTFIDAFCMGEDADPWDPTVSLPVPDRFTEQGEPPVVTLTDPPGRTAASRSPAAACSSVSRATPARLRQSFALRPIRPTTSRSSRSPSERMANRS